MLSGKLGTSSANNSASTTVSAESPLRASSSGYYTYTSPPRVLEGKFRRYRNNIAKPRGAHDYYNMMYDPHIFRGRATTSTASLSPKKRTESETEKKASTEPNSGEASKRRRKRSTTLYNHTTVTSNNYKITARLTARTKSLPRLDRQHCHVQTEEFLEDLSRDHSGEERDAGVQTDFVVREEDEAEGLGRASLVQEKGGVDVGTQVLPGELVSFDEAVAPVIEALVGRILQRALIETMEEEELMALQEQKNKFLERKAEEERLLRELEAHGLRENLDSLLSQAGISVPTSPSSVLMEILPSLLRSVGQDPVPGPSEIGDKGELDSANPEGESLQNDVDSTNNAMADLRTPSLSNEVAEG